MGLGPRSGGDRRFDDTSSQQIPVKPNGITAVSYRRHPRVGGSVIALLLACLGCAGSAASVDAARAPQCPEVVTEADFAPVATRLSRIIFSSAGRDHFCVGTERTVECWRSRGSAHIHAYRRPTQIVFPSGSSIRGLVSGACFACTLDEHGVAHCWGRVFDCDQQIWPPSQWEVSRPMRFPQPLTRLVAGQSTLCGTTSDGEVWCQGRRVPVPQRIGQVPEAEDLAVAFAEGERVIARSRAGVITWFEVASGVHGTFEGIYSALGTNPFYACTADDSGSVSCRRDGGHGWPPRGTVISVEARVSPTSRIFSGVVRPIFCVQDSDEVRCYAASLACRDVGCRQTDPVTPLLARIRAPMPHVIVLGASRTCFITSDAEVRCSDCIGRR